NGSLRLQCFPAKDHGDAQGTHGQEASCVVDPVEGQKAWNNKVNNCTGRCSLFAEAKRRSQAGSSTERNRQGGLWTMWGVRRSATHAPATQDATRDVLSTLWRRF